MDMPEPGAEDGRAALGGVRKTLGEVKVIGAVTTYYPRSGPWPEGLEVLTGGER